MSTKVLIHEWVTGGGLAGAELPASLAAEGGAMRRALAAEFASLDGVEVVTTLDERFAAGCDAGAVVAVGAGGEEAALRRLCRESDYTIVIAPETDGVLAARVALVETAGGRSLGSTPAAVRLASDKWRLSRHLAGRGIRSPRTSRFRPSSRLPRGLSYPAVVKPLDGAGSLHTYCLEGPSDAPFRDPLPPRMVLQPYCPGEAMSAGFLLGPSGSVRLVGTAWQDVETRDGQIRYRGGRVPGPAALASGAPLAAALSVAGLRGFVGVDFVVDRATATTTVIEINPRPTTSLVGFLRLLPPGALARAWLDTALAPEPRCDLRGMVAPGSSGCLGFLPDGTTFEPPEADDAPRP